MPLSKRILPHGKKNILKNVSGSNVSSLALSDNILQLNQTNNVPQKTVTLPVVGISAGTNVTVSESSGVYTINSSAGGGGGSGIVASSSQGEIPYYKTAGVAATISGTSAMTYNSTNESLNLHTSVAGDSSLMLRNTNAASTANGLSVFNESDSRRLDVGFNNNTDETYFWSYGDVPIKIATSGTERMRIAADGKVGIGTTAPQTTLHLNGSDAKLRLGFDSDSYTDLWTDTNGDFFIDNTGGPGDDIFVHGYDNLIVKLRTSSTNGSLLLVNESDAGFLTISETGTTSPKFVATTDMYYQAKNYHFFSGSTELVTIDGEAGNVGIGTTSPATKLDVVGTITAGDNSRMTIDDNKVKVDGDDLYISGSHDIILDANGANVYLSDGGEKYGAMNNNNANWDFDAKSHAHYLRFISSGGISYWGDGSQNEKIYLRGTDSIGTNSTTLANNYLYQYDGAGNLDTVIQAGGTSYFVNTVSIGTSSPTAGSILSVLGTMDVSNNVDVGNRVRKSATQFLDFSNTSTGLTLAGYPSFRPGYSGNAAGNGQDIGTSDYPWDKVYSQGLTLDNQTGGDDSPGAKTIWVSGSDVYWGTSKLNAQSGGGGTPGGSDTQIQFNNGGAFGGSANFTWNDTKVDIAQTADDTALEIAGYDDKSGVTAKLHVRSNGLSRFQGSTDAQVQSSAGSIYLSSSEHMYLDVGTRDTYSHIFRDDTGEFARFKNARLGIGITGPSNKLDVLDTSNPQLRLSYDGSNYNTFKTKGDGALEIKRNGTGLANRIGLLSGNSVILGLKAANSVSSGDGNIIIGYQAAYDLTTGDNNIVIGEDAGQNLTTNSNGVIIGYKSAYNTTAAAGTVAIGSEAMQKLTSGANNTAVGESAGYFVTSGNYNVAVGRRALFSNAQGDYNTAIGYFAGWTMDSTAGNSTFVGAYAGESYDGEGDSTFIGYGAGRARTGGSQAVSIGSSAHRNAGNSNSTVAIGYQAGYYNTGSNNVHIGTQAAQGDSASAGNSQVYIGKTAGYSSIAGDYTIGIGRNAGYFPEGNENIWIGHNAGYGTTTTRTANTNIGIGYYALDAVTTASYNIAMGYDAGGGITSGTNHVLIGRNAGKSITRGEGNVIIGAYAGDAIGAQTGEHTILGFYAGSNLRGNETHGRHLAIGAYALYNFSGTTDSSNTMAIGFGAGQSAQTLKSFMAIGSNAGYRLTGSNDGPILIGGNCGAGDAGGLTCNEDLLIGGAVAEYSKELTRNTIVGNRAFNSVYSGSYNTGVGYNVMRYGSGTAITGNVAFGHAAGASIGRYGTAKYNIAIGYETQEKQLIGERNIAIGYKVGIDGESTASDILRIGNAAGDWSFIRGDMANDNFWIGAGTPKFTLSGGNVGIGTTSPSQKLQLQGDSTYFSILAADGSEGVSLGTASSGRGLLYLKTATGGNSVYIDSGGDSYLNGGDVGIGTSSPDRLLHLSSAGTTFMKITSDDTQDWSIGANSTAGFTVYDETDSQYRFCIKDGGNVGIGTTAPAQLLDVSGGNIRGYKTNRSITTQPYYAVGGDNQYSSIFSSEGLMLGTTGDSYVDIWSTRGRYTRFRHATGSTTDGAMTYATGSTASTEFFRIQPTGTNYDKDANLYAPHHVTLAAGEDVKLDANEAMTFWYDTEFNMYNDQGTAAMVTFRSGTQAAMEFEADSDIQFKNNTTKLVKIASDGKVGIGTANPSQKLHVAGDFSLGSSVTLIENADISTISGTAFQYGIAESTYVYDVANSLVEAAVITTEANYFVVAPRPGANAGTPTTISTILPDGSAEVGMKVTISQLTSANPQAALSVTAQGSDVIYEGGSNTASAAVTIAGYRGANKTFLTIAAGVWIVID